MSQYNPSKNQIFSEERERLAAMKKNTVPYIRIRDRLDALSSPQNPFLASNQLQNDSRRTRGQSADSPVPWSPHLFSLLQGTRDESSPLNLLQGHESTIIQIIYRFLIDLWYTYAIKPTPPAFMIAKMRALEAHGHDAERIIHRGHSIPMRHVLIPTNGRPTALGASRKDRPEAAFAKCNYVEFPEPSVVSMNNAQTRRAININMMPFIMGDKDSLPDDIQCYYEGVIQKCPISLSEVGRVGFLTISEGFINADQTQRREGVHIECSTVSLKTKTKSQLTSSLPSPRQGISNISSSNNSKPGGAFIAAWEHSWGRGFFYTPDEFEGGLYMASNMDHTCQIWDALISPYEGIVNQQGGNADYLRPFLGVSTKLKRNELVWLTDRTPHEALPQEHDGFRQFFRLVTSDVSIWFEEHSTPNPKVPLPSYVTVIKGNKFA